MLGEQVAVVLGEVGQAGCHTPGVGTLIALHVAGENLEQYRLGIVVGADEGNLVPVVEHQVEVVQHLLSVDDLGQALDFKNVLAALAHRLECNIGESSA
ncbi:hypothetical protein DSECCO2_602540 [anaerobic digester metagenome]